MAAENIKIHESLIGSEECETVYLKEDEINDFLAKYLKENPDADVEHRFVNPGPADYTQNIEVRWLRPDTPPEAPPIIIREEAPIQATEQPPLKIVELPRNQPASPPPVIIREAPPSFTSGPSDPKVIYVPSQKSSFTERLEAKGEQKLSDVLKEVRSEKQNFKNSQTKLDIKSNDTNNLDSSIIWAKFDESIRQYEEQYRRQQTDYLKTTYTTTDSQLFKNQNEQQMMQNLLEEEEKRLKALKDLQLEEKRKHALRIQKLEELKQQEILRQQEFEEITRQELLKHQQKIEEQFKKSLRIEERKPEITNMSIQKQLYEEKLRKQIEEKKNFKQQQKYSEAAAYYTSLSQTELKQAEQVNNKHQFTGYENIMDQLRRQNQYEQSVLKKNLEEDQQKSKQQQQQQQQTHIIPITVVNKTERTKSTSSITAPPLNGSYTKLYEAGFYDYYSTTKSTQEKGSFNDLASNLLTKPPSNNNLIGLRVS